MILQLTLQKVCVVTMFQLKFVSQKTTRFSNQETVILKTQQKPVWIPRYLCQGFLLWEGPKEVTTVHNSVYKRTAYEASASFPAWVPTLVMPSTIKECRSGGVPCLPNFHSALLFGLLRREEILRNPVTKWQIQLQQLIQMWFSSQKS